MDIIITVWKPHVHLEGVGLRPLKVRASGYLMTGQRPEWPVGLTGMYGNTNDIKIIYPQSNGNAMLGAKL